MGSLIASCVAITRRNRGIIHSIKTGGAKVAAHCSGMRSVPKSDIMRTNLEDVLALSF
jgi:hypothetical protein